MNGKLLAGALLAGAASLCATTGFAHGVKADANKAVQAAFDIIETTIVTRGDTAVFTTRVRGDAGLKSPLRRASSRARTSMPMSGRHR